MEVPDLASGGGVKLFTWGRPGRGFRTPHLSCSARCSAGKLLWLSFVPRAAIFAFTLSTSRLRARGGRSGRSSAPPRSGTDAVRLWHEHPGALSCRDERAVGHIQMMPALPNA